MGKQNYTEWKLAEAKRIRHKARRLVKSEIERASCKEKSTGQRTKS